MLSLALKAFYCSSIEGVSGRVVAGTVAELTMFFKASIISVE